MSQGFRIIDDNGVWLTNPHQYPFANPEGFLYQPGEVLKVLVEKGSWEAAQIEAKVLVQADDPTKPAPKAKKAAEG